MKKYLLLIIMLIILITNIYCLQEGYATFGFGYRHISPLMENNESLRNHIGMININIRGYGFWQSSPIGLFVSGMIAIPIYVSSDDYGYGPGVYSGRLQDCILGIGLKNILGDNFTLFTGLGVGFNIEAMNINFDNGMRYNADILNFGIGGETGLKLDFNHTVHLMVGVNLLYTFVNYTYINHTDFESKDSKWGVNSVIYPGVFLGIGINRYY